MDRISNLCKIAFLSLIVACAPAHAQQPPIQQKLMNAICGELQPLIDYLNKDGYKMVFMGTTVTAGIFDSVWQRKVDMNFVIIRANQRTNEGCMISSGVVAWTGYQIEDKTAI